MKKLITLLLFVSFVSVHVYSQTVARKYEYAIVYLSEHNKNTLTIIYDNKKEEDFCALKNITLEKGEYKNNKYVVEALSYMDEQGYELVSSAIEDLWGGGNGYQYVLRRDIKK